MDEHPSPKVHPHPFIKGRQGRVPPSPNWFSSKIVHTWAKVLVEVSKWPHRSHLSIYMTTSTMWYAYVWIFEGLPSFARNEMLNFALFVGVNGTCSKFGLFVPTVKKFTLRRFFWALKQCFIYLRSKVRASWSLIIRKNAGQTLLLLLYISGWSEN